MAKVTKSGSDFNYEDGKFYDVPVRQVDREGGTQPRVAIDNPYVSELADVIRSGGTFREAPVVFWDGKRLILADGFHRFAAYLLAKIATIKVQIRFGDKRAAFLYGCGANNTHGKRATDADKKYSLFKILKDPEMDLSGRELAKLFAVDEKQIRRWKKELAREEHQLRLPTRTAGPRGVIEPDSDPSVGGSSLASVVPEASARAAGDPFHKFTRSLQVEGISFKSNVKTDVGMVRVVTSNAIYDVVSLLTPGSFAESFGGLILQGLKHYPKHHKVIVGHVTEELAAMVETAGLAGVTVKNLD